MADVTFSLKDQLFNKQKIELIAAEIHAVYPAFDEMNFIAQTIAPFPELELKQRINWICKTLQRFLPVDYKEAVTILLKSLPPAADNTKTDNDFGDFIYAPYCDFVAKHGCTKEHLEFSLNALKEITTRFSVEDAIRYFINAFPQETFQELEKWSTDEHYHVRRLASEGTRPKLPWCMKINTPPEKALPLLENLYYDNTRYVTRSVANHMNDLSKVNPGLTIETLRRWQKSGKQDAKEMEYIIKHSLRTLVKQGHKEAIEFLNYSTDPQIKLADFKILTPTVKTGSALEFQLSLTALKDERIVIDYTIYFANKSGSNNNKKVFKLKQLALKKNETVTITKRHPLKVMTTRTLYPGTHVVEIQVNGKKLDKEEFQLVN